MEKIEETNATSAETFEREVLARGEPVIIRGLFADWPLVQAGLKGSAAACDYLRQFDRGHGLTSMIAPPSVNGRFFYNDDVTGFNFQHQHIPLSQALDALLKAEADSAPPAIAIQSVPTRQNMPGFEEQHPNPLLAEAVEPRAWIGNRATVAAHHDQSENIAVCAVGRRTFTIFPPDQVGNLYQGPFELTPARATISMVDFDNPDREKFPRFDEAMRHARIAELEPGDAVYVPYLWWHHVRAHERLNILINYWWRPQGLAAGEPRDAMIHAMLAIGKLAPDRRAAWKAMFDHYVFEENGPAGEHLPPKARGVMGSVSPQTIRSIRTSLARALMTDPK